MGQFQLLFAPPPPFYWMSIVTANTLPAVSSLTTPFLPSSLDSVIIFPPTQFRHGFCSKADTISTILYYFWMDGVFSYPPYFFRVIEKEEQTQILFGDIQEHSVSCLIVNNLWMVSIVLFIFFFLSFSICIIYARFGIEWRNFASGFFFILRF